MLPCWHDIVDSSHMLLIILLNWGKQTTEKSERYFNRLFFSNSTDFVLGHEDELHTIAYTLT